MIKKLPFLLLQLLFWQIAHSQNIGIGTTTPLSKLDVNGDFALRSADLTIASTYTYALDVNTVKQSNYKLKSAPLLGNFILAGITAGTNSRIITLTNRTANSMEIYNEDATANANDRIQTGTGGTLAVYPNGSVTLQYEVPEQRWVIKSGHNNSLSYFGGGEGTSYWSLSGANISNTNTGNVGIGTASPTHKLSVVGNTRLNGPPLTAGSLGYLTGGGFLHLINNSNSSVLNLDAGVIQAETLKTFPQSGSSASNLSFNPFGGHVGIGITDNNMPYKLSINQSTVDPGSHNSLALQLKGSNPLLNFVDAFNVPTGYIKGISSLAYTPQFSRAGIEIGTGGGDIYLTALGYIPALMVNGTNNNVGIGTNNPTEKLSVNGTIRAKEIVVESGWADYVFADDYQLPTLESVAKHINENKHLPGIPSAATIQKDGLSVGAVQTKMMEKIEELVLYVIELKKEIELLKSKK